MQHAKLSQPDLSFDEILLDDARRLAEKAAQSGVQVSIEACGGMWHVLAGFMPEARMAVGKLGAFIRRHCA